MSYSPSRAPSQVASTRGFSNCARSLSCLGLVSLSLYAIAAHAQSVQVTPAQIKALGIAFSAPQSQSGQRFQAPARVVPSLGAQTIVALPYAGMVTRVLVNAGDAVKAGQPLLVVMSPAWLEAQRSASEAQSQAQLTQQILKREEALLAEGIIPEARVQATRAKAREMNALRQARQAEVGGAKLRASGNGEAQLLASQAGTVTQLSVVPGQRVEAATPLLRLTQTERLELELQLANGVVPQLGDQVEVPSHQASGKVLAVVPSGDGVASMKARASLQKMGSLQNGAMVTAQLSSASHHAATTATVPERALLFVKGREGVLTSPDGKTIRFTPVQVARYGNEQVSLAQPLPSNVRVVVSGMVALKALLLESPEDGAGGQQ